MDAAVRDSKNPTGPALVFGPTRVGRLHHWHPERRVQPALAVTFADA
ncbi:DUF397 domain-containing protein [Nocardia sp. CA-119907]